MQLRVEKKILKLIGATIRTYGADGQLVVRADQKGFKLKEQIDFFQDDQKTIPLFSIQARSIIDFGATYDIKDPNGQLLASMRREGLKSMFVQDSWLVLNAQGQEIARVSEDSALMGFVRRQFGFVALFLPQVFVVSVQGRQVGELKQNKNPLTVRYDVNFTPEGEQLMGSYLMLAIPNLITVIEGRQS